MGLTLGNMRARLERRLEVASGSTYSAAELNDYIGDAAFDLWSDVYDANRHILPYTKTDYTWVANTIEVDYSAATPGGLGLAKNTEILQVQMFPNTTAEGTGNRPFPIVRVPWEDIDGAMSDYTEISYEAAQALQTSVLGGVWAYRWAMHHTTLRLGPVPQRDVKLRVYSAVPFTRPSADNDAVLPEPFDRWDRWVVLKAVLDAMARIGQETTPTYREWQAQDERFKRWMVRRELHNTPTRRFEGV